MSSNGGINLATAVPAAVYWEDRARRYAVQGAGLAAVCSYGMPAFYNRAIDLTQRLALQPWLRGVAGKDVLDVGCGVGRWSRWMASAGAQVTGVDLSHTMTMEAKRRADTMTMEAKRRAEVEGLSPRCQFLTQDLAELKTGSEYELILAVTVLQHILDENRLEDAVSSLRHHLSPPGRLVLLEAAPSLPNSRCDTAVFQARNLEFYLKLFSRIGLQVETITGVDPTPLKTRFLPYYRNLPRPAALAGLFAATAVSLPLDAVFGRRWVNQSWHKVMILRHGD
jgi:2-polyprenyl-3-methyl-5-hydroxy-6-metoxy-1,4-benzoquinol methylase